MNLLTIVTINKNNYNGLIETFNSVRIQKYQDFDYVVIDGNSSDGCDLLIHGNLDIITSYLIESDTGIYNAMNKGISMVKTPYVLFLNSGDKLFDEFVIDEIMGFISQNPEVDIIYGDALKIKEGNQYLWRIPNYISLNYILNNSICHSSTVYKNSLFKEVGKYDESLKIVSDWKILLLSKLNGYSLRKINKVLSYYDMHGISVTMKDLNYKERIRVKMDYSISIFFSRVLEYLYA